MLFSAIALRGHPIDLENWRDALPAPFDPNVVALDHESGSAVFILRSTELPNGATADEMEKAAVSLLERLNGAVMAARGGEPVEFAGAVELDEAGQLVSVHWMKHIHTTVRARSGALSIETNGAPLPPKPPAESSVQAWSAKAAANRDIAQLLTHTGRADNWIDLYKALETCERIAGGLHRVAAFAGVSEARYKTVRATANHHRHAKAHLPTDPPTFAEAHAFVTEVVRNVLGKAPS
jgi:hypothetical protein